MIGENGCHRNAAYWWHLAPAWRHPYHKIMAGKLTWCGSLRETSPTLGLWVRTKVVCQLGQGRTQGRVFWWTGWWSSGWAEESIKLDFVLSSCRSWRVEEVGGGNQSMSPPHLWFLFHPVRTWWGWGGMSILCKYFYGCLLPSVLLRLHRFVSCVSLRLM